MNPLFPFLLVAYLFISKIKVIYSDIRVGFPTHHSQQDKVNQNQKDAA